MVYLLSGLHQRYFNPFANIKHFCLLRGFKHLIKWKLKNEKSHAKDNKRFYFLHCSEVELLLSL